MVIIKKSLNTLSSAAFRLGGGAIFYFWLYGVGKLS